MVNIHEPGLLEGRLAQWPVLAVAGALEVRLAETEAEVEQEVSRYAEGTGRTPAAVRARLEKEGGLSRIYAGLRREKSIDFLMSRATISGE